MASQVNHDHSVRILARRPKVRAYYAAEGAFYAASVGMLLLWEERRRDFAVMMLHHLTTCGLIAASYSMRCAGTVPCVTRRQGFGES